MGKDYRTYHSGPRPHNTAKCRPESTSITPMAARSSVTLHSRCYTPTVDAHFWAGFICSTHGDVLRGKLVLRRPAFCERTRRGVVSDAADGSHAAGQGGESHQVGGRAGGVGAGQVQAVAARPHKPSGRHRLPDGLALRQQPAEEAAEQRDHHLRARQLGWTGGLSQTLLPLKGRRATSSMISPACNTIQTALPSDQTAASANSSLLGGGDTSPFLNARQYTTCCTQSSSTTIQA